MVGNRSSRGCAVPPRGRESPESAPRDAGLALRRGRGADQGGTSVPPQALASSSRSATRASAWSGRKRMQHRTNSPRPRTRSQYVGRALPPQPAPNDSVLDAHRVEAVRGRWVGRRGLWGTSATTADGWPHIRSALWPTRYPRFASLRPSGPRTGAATRKSCGRRSGTRRSSASETGRLPGSSRRRHDA